MNLENKKPVVLSQLGYSSSEALLTTFPNSNLLLNSSFDLEIREISNESESAVLNNNFILSNGNQINLTGKISATQNAAQGLYGMIDNGTHFTVFPLQFVLKFLPNNAANLTEDDLMIQSDLLKHNRIVEEQIIKNVCNNENKFFEEGDNKTTSVVSEKKKSSTQKKKVDEERKATSLLKITHIESNDADWDYNNKVATDDEDMDDSSESENLTINADLLDNENEEDFSKYGTKLYKAMKNMNELTVEQEFKDVSNLESDEGSSIFRNEPSQNSTNLGQFKSKSFNINVGDRENTNKMRPIYDRLETKECIREKLLKFVRKNPNCELRRALEAINIDMRGGRLEVIRAILREDFVITTELVKNVKVRYISVKKP